jgi:hypothetical protein
MDTKKAAKPPTVAVGRLVMPKPGIGVIDGSNPVVAYLADSGDVVGADSRRASRVSKSAKATGMLNR